MARSQRYRYGLSYPWTRLPVISQALFITNVPTRKQHQTTSNAVVFTKVQAYSRSSMECSAQENSMLIASAPVRDKSDNGFGLE
jgi:hypothetical protein